MYFDENNPLSRASDANVSTAILGSSQIVAEKEGKLLIGVDNLFLTEALHQITRGFVPAAVKKSVSYWKTCQRSNKVCFTKELS